ncbi:PEP-CTERM sorting domain-containing protein [Bryobacter aggregatus]|uniref:PEP-CTERM sorting domain-containing protein n=1 Tax=Bryobacter aggregatus TaxID=360054 RepID=UPI0004E24DC3|nr:PEP-CTERM sorting domain-containing protein [Bryobacter aggregatus]
MKALIAILAIAAALPAATLNLQLPASAFTVGQTFTATVTVEDPFEDAPLDESLLAFGFDQTFSNLGLSLQSIIVAAPFFEYLNANLIAGTLLPGEVTNTGQNSVLLATLTFRAESAGATTIFLSMNESNLDHGFLYAGLDTPTAYSSTSQLVTVNDVSSIPEPGTYLLIGAGLIFFALRPAMLRVASA